MDVADAAARFISSTSIRVTAPSTVQDGTASAERRNITAQTTRIKQPMAARVIGTHPHCGAGYVPAPVEIFWRRCPP